MKLLLLHQHSQVPSSCVTLPEARSAALGLTALRSEGSADVHDTCFTIHTHARAVEDAAGSSFLSALCQPSCKAQALRSQSQARLRRGRCPGTDSLKVILNSSCSLFPLKFRVPHSPRETRAAGCRRSPPTAGRRKGRGFSASARPRGGAGCVRPPCPYPTWPSIPASNPPSSSSKGRKRRGEERAARRAARAPRCGSRRGRDPRRGWCRRLDGGEAGPGLPSGQGHPRARRQGRGRAGSAWLPAGVRDPLPQGWARGRATGRERGARAGLAARSHCFASPLAARKSTRKRRGKGKRMRQSSSILSVSCFPGVM